VAVITISRQYAAGGSNVARLLSDRLGWPVIDNEFVDQVAEQAGLPREVVEEREERVPGLAERLARALAVSSPEVFVTTGEPPDTQTATEGDLVRATEAVIAKAVEHTPNLILVGRGAQAYLGRRGDALHVLVVGPRDARIAAAIKRLGVSPHDAEATVDEKDEGRRRYVKTNYGRAWDEAANYDLVVNTGTFGYEQTVDLIVEAAKRRGWVR
jgi:cytidylate kinase